MIRSIRNRHRIIWAIIAIVLPLLFIASIMFRHSDPINQTVPKRVETTGGRR